MLTTRRSSVAGVLGASAALLASSGVVVGAACAVQRHRRLNRLNGAVVVITGSSRGLGLALAHEFGRHGAKLVLAARNADTLDRARSLLVDSKRVDADAVICVPGDLGKAEDVEVLIRRATEHFGPIDFLINNAGVMMAGPVERMSTEDFHGAMNANFFSAVNCSLAVLPQMLERRRGTIVNIASIGGKVAVPHMLPYSASKFALVGFSQGLHAETRLKGVHVLTVCPGLMRTGSHLHAAFTGNAEAEYRWFSLMASLPGVSIAAHRAAQKIVNAAVAKRTEISITPQAQFASRFSQMLPGTVACFMSAANMLLPAASSSSSSTPRTGADLREHELKPAAVCGWRAAQKYNQFA